MKNIHEPATLNDLLQRFNKLTPATQRLWGKMDVARMMAHLSTALEVNLGDRATKQGIIGKLFGRIAKRSIVNDQPFKQGLPTDPSFVITEACDFDKEKQRVTALVSRVSASDSVSIAANPHPFFGRMTAQEWDTLNFKHIDHHLRQFGV